VAAARGTGTGKILHQGLELVDHRRDDRDQERRRQAARDQEDDQYGQAAAHAPAGQHAHRRVQADRDEQRDEHPDQQRTGGVDRDGSGGHREDARVDDMEVLAARIRPARTVLRDVTRTHVEAL
jgi:hypothetical protein